MKKVTTYTTRQLIATNKAAATRELTSKYQQIIKEAKYYIASGATKKEGICMSFDELDFLFTSEADKENLYNWCVTYLKDSYTK